MTPDAAPTHPPAHRALGVTGGSRPLGRHSNDIPPETAAERLRAVSGQAL